MSTKFTFLRWAAAGLLTMAVASSCDTSGPHGADTSRSFYRVGHGVVVVGDTTYWDLDPAAGSIGINEKNHYYHRFIKLGDSTCYEQSGYYITHPHGSVSKPQTSFTWKYPPRGLIHPFANGDTYEENGSYTCITHPPGGPCIECGSVTMITHPPGAVATPTPTPRASGN